MEQTNESGRRASIRWRTSALNNLNSLVSQEPEALHVQFILAGLKKYGLPMQNMMMMLINEGYEHVTDASVRADIEKEWAALRLSYFPDQDNVSPSDESALHAQHVLRSLKCQGRPMRSLMVHLINEGYKTLPEIDGCRAVLEQEWSSKQASLSASAAEVMTAMEQGRVMSKNYRRERKYR